jgi:hypothetical protein
MSAEQAYRAALRWYPGRWRDRNEDVVVGTLLDVADAEGRQAPTREELRDLRRSGLAARADVILPGAIRDRTAAISLGAGSALALALLTGQVWSAWGAQGSPAEPTPDGIVWQILIQPGLWLLAALATLAGLTIVARVLLIATLPASVIVVTATDVSFLLRPSMFTLVMLGLLALMSCVGRAPRRWQLVATGVAVVLIASWLAFLGPFARTYFPRGGLIDFIASPWPAVTLLIAAAVLMIRGRRVAAASVIAVSAPWLVILIGQVFIYNGVANGIPFDIRLFVIAAVLAVIPVAILLVVRRYARPPWLSPSESSDSPTSASRRSSTR